MFIATYSIDLNETMGAIKKLIEKWIIEVIPKHFYYDQIKANKYLEDKKAFQFGVDYFDSKNYHFPTDLSTKLRREAGLANVAMENKQLLKYAIHCYKQLEIVYSEFVLNEPGRSRIAIYLLNNDHPTSPRLISITNSASQKNLKYSTELCLVRKLNFVAKHNGTFSQTTVSVGSNNNQYKWNLSASDRNKIFKATLYFNPFDPAVSQILSTSAGAITDKPSLHAHEHMYYFRNLGSHLNKDNQSLPFPTFSSQAETVRVKPFFDDPELVLDRTHESPGFYQRYIDMVLHLYSEFLKSPQF